VIGMGQPHDVRTEQATAVEQLLRQAAKRRRLAGGVARADPEAREQPTGGNSSRAPEAQGVTVLAEGVPQRWQLKEAASLTGRSTT
jgi:hypothetical protein